MAGESTLERILGAGYARMNAAMVSDLVKALDLRNGRNGEHPNDPFDAWDPA